MSIEKEVERMYREDQEMQKKNEKKKKSGKLITIIIIILIIAAVLFLLNYLGLGLGGGKGSGGDSKGEADTKAAKTTTVTTTEVAKEYESVKVSGSTYIYNGNVVELDTFIDTVSKMNDNVVVLIEDDNATQNAMEDLKSALDKSGRAYAEETADNADTENASEAE